MKIQRTYNEALGFARSLMSEYLSLDWRVEINFRMKSQYAWCNHITRTISVNANIARYAIDHHFEQLMLHEIAHGVLNGEGHTRKFRDQCKAMGCYAYKSYFDGLDYCFP